MSNNEETQVQAPAEAFDAAAFAEEIFTKGANPPGQIGMGYNTYFVNQTGKDIWVGYRCGMQGGSGPVAIHRVYAGQNVGYGRGGLTISELAAWDHEPSGYSEPAQTYWRHDNINGAQNWGFRFGPPCTLVEASGWILSPGMGGPYPPAWGNAPH